jgi:hypothetical protein
VLQTEDHPLRERIRLVEHNVLAMEGFDNAAEQLHAIFKTVTILMQDLMDCTLRLLPQLDTPESRDVVRSAIEVGEEIA